MSDFISFDWSNDEISDRVLKLNNGKVMHCVVSPKMVSKFSSSRSFSFEKIYKEEVESYSENTDEPVRKSFNILVKLALHVMNLLPIPIQCAIDVRLPDLELLHHFTDLLEC